MNSNKSFKEQVDINLANPFSGATMIPVRKVFQKGNTCVISLLMFYENRKNVKFKLLSSIVYCVMYNSLCVDYLCCKEKTSCCM